MNVVVNGLMTSYHRTGKGKTLVFLHGWGDTGASFSKLIEELQNKYEILTLDLPGFGGTQPPESAWGLEDYADFVADWLEKLKINKVYAWLGHSYGGAVAIYGLGTNKLSGEYLVLLASAGVRDKKQLRKKAMWVAAKLAKIPLSVLPHSKRQKLRSRFYEAAGSDIMLLPHMELTFKRIIGEDVQHVAKSIKTPTLLIYGSKDKAAPASYGKILNKAISNSELKILPDLGHFLHQEQPQELAGLINAFLESES